MLRRHFSLALIGLLMTATAIVAETPTRSLDHVLRLNEVMTIMRDEGLRYGADLDTDMLGGNGGEYFGNKVQEIYDRDLMVDTVNSAMASQMTDVDIAATIAFFDTDLGQRILSLENAARVAMSDPSVEEIARDTYADLVDSDDARFAAVSRFVEINDLVERNVTSALSSNYHFFSGLSNGGGAKMGDDEILSELWGQEAELRQDTVSWLYGFLLMAYRPLDDDELEAYIAFSATPEGQALNAGLFAGFDAMYQTISYALGQAVAQSMGGSDI